MIKNLNKENVSNVTKTYVVDDENKDFGNAGGDILLRTEIASQNNGITLDFNSCGDHSKKVYSGEDIEGLIKELQETLDLYRELII